MATENSENSRGYEILGEKLKEKYGHMTPEEIEDKWGKGMSSYLQDIDGFMTHLGRELREVEKRKERVPEEFYDQTQGLSFRNLKEWYNSNEGLKANEKRLKEIVYKERMLEHIARKFGVHIEPAGNRKRQGYKIRTPGDLKELCETDPRARYLVQLCQGDDVDVADIIAVVYDGLITRREAIEMLQNPSLREYLGEFVKPIIDPEDIKECAEELLHLDKNKVIAGILYKRLIQYRRQKLGSKPSEEQRAEFVREMNETLEDLV